MIRRIRLTVSYDGTDFHGWQVQPRLPTIQGTLETILSEIEGSAVKLMGSGRTDAGVHALRQVAACSMENPIPPPNLTKAVNRLLPPSIRVLDAADTWLGFQPRFDALAKTYEYRIVRSEQCSPFEWRYVHHHPYPLKETAMAEAAPILQGEHDFSAFAASDHRDAHGRSKVRTIFSSSLERDGDRLVYRVRGSGFLKHMVRNLVGTLLEVGKGNLDGDGIRQLLLDRDRKLAGPAVPAKGLFLICVEYPDAPRPVSEYPTQESLDEEE
ncbi:MAG: tRNA pseudouridine(38-40) synthase TruA [Bryobacteraceae bacterium]